MAEAFQFATLHCGVFGGTLNLTRLQLDRECCEEVGEMSLNFTVHGVVTVNTSFLSEIVRYVIVDCSGDVLSKEEESGETVTQKM